ncbi:MAG: DMT family protein [Oligoflexia bacterium]|nr:DMT family protein [Oligoflexia bacterium]
MFKTIILLVFSNIFMTFAWYGHLKNLKTKHIVIAILVSWGIAFFEYCLQVPANRIGSSYFTLSQLKVIQEIITMIVFAIFAALYMKAPLTKNLLFAGLCLVAAAYFIFQDNRPIN